MRAETVRRAQQDIKAKQARRDKSIRSTAENAYDSGASDAVHGPLEISGLDDIPSLLLASPKELLTKREKKEARGWGGGRVASTLFIEEGLTV